jgi:uncharacterized LabA/DUF88 family protein
MQNHFNLHQDETTTVLIDGSSIFHSSRQLGIQIDYAKMRDFFEKNTKLARIVFYTVLFVEEDEENPEFDKHNPIKPMVDWMVYNGFRTVTNEKIIRGGGGFRAGGNMTAQIATDIMVHAEHSDKIVIFSGNNDLAYAVQAAQARYGTRFVGCSLIKSSINMGDDFRRAVDISVPLENQEVNSLFSKLDSRRAAA